MFSRDRDPAPATPYRPGIILAKDRSSIAIAGSAVKKLEITLSEGDSVCLRRDGKQISVPDAAILLLDPLLFEGLPARQAGDGRPIVTIER